MYVWTNLRCWGVGEGLLCLECKMLGEGRRWRIVKDKSDCEDPWMFFRLKKEMDVLREKQAWSSLSLEKDLEVMWSVSLGF